MSISIDELFKYSIVISRQQRRLDLLKMSFTVAGLPLPAVHMEPMRTCHNGTESCKMTHCKAVKYAAECNWPYVLIFEDDAWPRSDAKQQLATALNYIDFSIIPLFSLGYTSVKFSNNELICRMFKEVNQIVGFHSYVVTNKCFGQFAKGFDGKHIDIIVSRNAKMIFGSPMYALQDYIFIQYTRENEPNADRRDYFENRHGYGIAGAYRQDTALNQLFNVEEYVVKKFNEKYALDNFNIPVVYADII